MYYYEVVLPGKVFLAEAESVSDVFMAYTSRDEFEWEEMNGENNKNAFFIVKLIEETGNFIGNLESHKAELTKARKDLIEDLGQKLGNQKGIIIKAEWREL